MCHLTPLMLLLYAFKLLLYSIFAFSSTARTASRRQLQTTGLSHIARARPAARAGAGMVHVHEAKSCEAGAPARGRRGAAGPDQSVHTYVRPSQRARVHSPAGQARLAQRYSITSVARGRPDMARAREAWSIRRTGIPFLSLPAPMSCGGTVRVLHAHSTSVRAIRDGAACPHLGGPGDRGPGLLGHLPEGR